MWLIDWLIGRCRVALSHQWLVARIARVCSLRDIWTDWARATFKSMFGNLELSDSVTPLFSTLVSSSEERLGPDGRDTGNASSVLFLTHSRVSQALILNEVSGLEWKSFYEVAVLGTTEISRWWPRATDGYAHVFLFFLFFGLMVKAAAITNVYYSYIMLL